MLKLEVWYRGLYVKKEENNNNNNKNISNRLKVEETPTHKKCTLMI